MTTALDGRKFFFHSAQLIVCVSRRCHFSLSVVCFYYFYFLFPLKSPRLKLLLFLSFFLIIKIWATMWPTLHFDHISDNHSVDTLISFFVFLLTYLHSALIHLMLNPDVNPYPHNRTISCRPNMNRSVCHRPIHTICWDRIRIVDPCICMFAVSLQMGEN